MTVQRRHGQWVTIWPSVTKLDSRNNEVVTVDEDNPLRVRGMFFPQRSGRAELHGQQQINVVRMLVKDHLPGVDLWSRVFWDDKVWDVVTPPSYHHGTPRVRHWSIDIRERPSG